MPGQLCRVRKCHCFIVCSCNICPVFQTDVHVCDCDMRLAFSKWGAQEIESTVSALMISTDDADLNASRSKDPTFATARQRYPSLQEGREAAAEVLKEIADSSAHHALCFQTTLEPRKTKIETSSVL